MQRILLSFVLALVANVLFAQVSFNGKILNEQQQPLANATVLLKNVSTKQVLKTTSNDDGFFSFSSLKEYTKWKLNISYTGKNIYATNILVNSSNIDETYVLNDSQQELEPLEVRAVRASDKSPFTKTNISAAEIEKNNLGKDLPFLLNQTPNVVVNSDAGNGIGYTGITIRGSDATRTNVTINGIPNNDAEDQGVYFIDMPDLASSVGSIQIQRGVGSSTNGAGAFGATVNLSTNEVHDSAYATFSNSYGSFNTWKNTVAAGSGLVDGKFTADVRLSNISSDGYIDRAKSNLQSLFFSTAYIGKKTTVRFNFITGKEKTYQAWDGVSEDILPTDRTYNELGYINDSTFYKNETDNYWQSHYQLFITHRFNEKLSFNLTSFLVHGYGYYEEYKTDADYSSYGIPYPVSVSGDTTYSTDLVRQKWLKNNFYGQTFSLQYKNTNDELTFGGAWTNYDGQHYGNVIWAQNGGVANDYEYYNVPAYKYDKSIYLKWLHTFDEYWNLYADVQYRNVWYHIYGFEDDPELIRKSKFNFVNPKAGISYTRNGYNAYLSYALANKEPSRDDYEAGLDNQPKPEKLHDFELGAEKKAAKYNWGINLYYMLYKDQLVLTGKLNDVGAATRINVPNSYRAGIELQGGYVFSNWLNAAANLSFSRNKIKDFTAYYNAYDADWNELPQVAEQHHNTDIALSPSVVGAGTINILPFKNLELSLISKYVGRRYMDNTQNSSRIVAAYYNQDARIIYTIKTNFFKELSIIGSVYNVFNTKYNSIGYTYPEYEKGKVNNWNYFFPMAGTNYMVGVNIKL
ncbi:TonB-dependent receptor [Arachidicoccus ginsenosidimutans]|uniref:TonB-dependent receptor n=1 Tax=Arachidicoccus sp. BS20 TaxID=1850526 RepID=UPI0007F0712A|nr:TonB-dependent receptor [Arachidicoccus sp. BS20]ANI88052.1 TonB-dependent receptor [Arachidicoccus sp. BS20]